MQSILEAILGGASGDELAAMPLPESYRAMVVRKDEVGMFEGMESAAKDPRKSLHLEDVPLPELAPDEAYVAVMASSINFNTVWTSIFEPLPTFMFLERYGKESAWAKRHDLPYQVVGSDASGVVLRVGSAVRNWKPGDKVTVHCNSVDDQDPSAHDDSMLATNQRIWGFETNFGGLADLALVKANQLMPKPTHLTWEESAVNALCNSTSYRMLVGEHGARMKQGDVVLVWGATGGIGGYAVQYVLNGGGIPVGVVSSPDKAELLHDLGCEAVIDRAAGGYRFWKDANTQDESEWRRFGKDVRARRRRRPRHRVRASGSADDGRVGVRREARRNDRHVRGDVGLHGRVRQPALLDEAQAADREPLRELPRGVGGEPAHQPRRDPAVALRGVSARRHGRGCVPGPQEPARGQDRRALPRARRRPRHRRPRAAREGGRGSHHGLQEARMSPQVVRGPNDDEHSGQGFGGELTLGEPLLTEIDHVAIAVHDLDAAIDYYRDVFGADRRAPRDRALRRCRRGPAEGR